MQIKPLFAAGILAGSALTPPAQAKEYPRQPIQVVVPYAAGGNLDVTARAIAQPLAEALKGSVVIVNKPGAGGSVASTYVSRAKPDGYTVMITANTELSVTPYITGAPYSMDSFASVGTINTVPMLIEVHPDSKYRQIGELIKAACAQPDTVTMGVAGIGSVNYMALRFLEQATQCRFRMVPYQGSGPAVTALLGNQVDAVIDQVSSSQSYLRTGKLRALAMMSPQRPAGWEDVPTLAESGIEGADMATMAALVTPKDVSEDIRNKLSAALKLALSDARVQENIKALGGIPYTAEHDDFMAEIKPLRALAEKYKAEGRL
ncbi:tripartite tricarboxylate transporter substrate binding protein [Verticiella sediminum]|uniref:Tripartite tricarboxylate transporter substrate binding protein n=1 Tax=Verticiella sediminum TaxID=1247510 RepID=A0A556AYB9_9BURK|nr:tripartite tricarboxylate transporter substrate binding protein [Verticiella sediminum]TSH97943.1 tripartite tricarboxylate transporter substrate binding protein [Verticiella sediminum]